MACLKAMLKELHAVQGPLPHSKAALVEELVLHLLYVDLQPYSKVGKGVTKSQQNEHSPPAAEVCGPVRCPPSVAHLGASCRSS